MQHYQRRPRHYAEKIEESPEQCKPTVFQEKKVRSNTSRESFCAICAYLGAERVLRIVCDKQVGERPEDSSTTDKVEYQEDP
jgi:hypothetical protein